MKARYLIRLDDACPGMDHRKWQMIEDVLDGFGIKPLVAVVPDNHDPELDVHTRNPFFWDKVRCWKEKGWTIAMHGYRHVMHHTTSKLVLPFYERSEFGGLPYGEQAEKIRLSWSIFVSQGIIPTVWIAPAHCFDLLTLKAIREETLIRIVSDGIARNEYYEHGFFWLPQQLWGLTEKSDGLWTVCLHPNTMSDVHITVFGNAIEQQYLSRIIALENVALRKRKRSMIDLLDHHYFWLRHRAFKVLNKVKLLINP